jgi:parallel beta-helix repeat protein
MVNSTVVKTLYVNPATGNDKNPGSSKFSPLKTISRALKLSTKSTIIQLAVGNYNSLTGEVFPLLIPDGVLVVGNEGTKGRGIVIEGSGAYQSQSFGWQNITLLLLGEATVMGVTVANTAAKGTGVWIESTAPSLVNNTFTKCGREALFVTGSAKPAILDNVFVQNAVSGLVMAGNSKGEVLRNIFQKNIIGIAISDSAAPMLVKNKLIENRTAIALSRQAQPLLRQNLIANNTQGGVFVNGNALPNLGNKQDNGENVFRDNGQFDLQNATSKKLVSVGNELNPAQVKGLVELIAVKKNIQVLRTLFSDMAGHWAADFVEALANKNLINSLTDGTFAPNNPMTRADYAALVAAAFNPTPRHPAPDFIDVPKDFWAYNAIQIAAMGGFVGGKSDRTFSPHENVQRLQVIVSLVNGLKLPPAQSDALLCYSDRNTILDYARTAVATATQQKIVVNYPNPKQIEPSRFATRAEVAAMVYQALVAIKKSPLIKSPYIVSNEGIWQVE